MTDRERLEGIIENTLGYPLDRYGSFDLYDKGNVDLLIDVLIDNGVTFKKKREHIRKSPCKCGASNRTVFVETKVSFGDIVHRYYCIKCHSSTRYFSLSKKKALTEWNKMNEVK